MILVLEDTDRGRLGFNRVVIESDASVPTVKTVGYGLG